MNTNEIMVDIQILCAAGMVAFLHHKPIDMRWNDIPTGTARKHLEDSIPLNDLKTKSRVIHSIRTDRYSVCFQVHPKQPPGMYPKPHKIMGMG